MSYNILPYSYKEAQILGVEIVPSKNKKKKIDVYKNGKKVASIGAIGYGDYPHYLKVDKDLAKKKRTAYHLRHYKDIQKVNSPGWYAAKILW